jgi:hypothetical protein
MLVELKNSILVREGAGADEFKALPAGMSQEFD